LTALSSQFASGSSRGTAFAVLAFESKRQQDIHTMHIVNSWSGLLLLTEATLWTRIAVQGWELALASIAVEWCAKFFRGRFASSAMKILNRGKIVE
jgi:hypothetical protein